MLYAKFSDEIAPTSPTHHACPCCRESEETLHRSVDQGVWTKASRLAKTLRPWWWATCEALWASWMGDGRARCQVCESIIIVEKPFDCAISRRHTSLVSLSLSRARARYTHGCHASSIFNSLRFRCTAVELRLFGPPLASHTVVADEQSLRIVLVLDGEQLRVLFRTRTFQSCMRK